ncbi:amidohydrolase family protein [Agrobacterium tumefaciens]|uniref:amidohydrolase family protein n=1 Tax=Agrobacterium tumefaciens TaxID=358 RepID=UPI0039A5DA3F
MNAQTSPRSLGTGLFAGACDAHVHVFDPKNHPYHPGRSYTPGEANCGQLEQLMRRMGMDRCVLVQPSVYGSDNRCLVSALRHFGPDRARGVAVVDYETVTLDQLADLWNVGVRAIRVNFEAAKTAAPRDKLLVIAETAKRAKEVGMAVQLYVDTHTAVAAIERLEGENVPLILDHFAGFKCGMDRNDEAFKKLLSALGRGRVWIKLSAPCRTGSQLVDYEDLRPAAQAMINAAPERMLWASDWPHTGGGADRAKRSASEIEPFRQVNDDAEFRRLRSWIGDETRLARILSENPTEIFDFFNHP